MPGKRWHLKVRWFWLSKDMFWTGLVPFHTSANVSPLRKSKLRTKDDNKHHFAESGRCFGGFFPNLFKLLFSLCWGWYLQSVCVIENYLSVAFDSPREWHTYQRTPKFCAFRWEVTYSHLHIFQNTSCLQSTGILLGDNCDQGPSQWLK